MTKTIVLIHGAWTTPASFANFRHFYEARGYTVLSPPWPLMDRSIAELRADPHPQFGELTLGKIVAHYAAIIESLPEKPILIGHSYGGLIVQMLLDRGYGAAGVSIAPAPAAGIVAGPKALRAALPVFLAWRGWSRALRMTRKQFAWSMGNTLSAEAQVRAFDEHVVPAPGRIYYQSILGIGSAIEWRKSDRAPLLLIAAENDRTVQPSMVRQQYRRYRKGRAFTEIKILVGHSHLLITEPGWEEVADLTQTWVTALGSRTDRHEPATATAT